MIHRQFLSRWPTGRGAGCIGYSHSLRMALVSVGSLALLDHPFEVVAVNVFNTSSLRDGDVEAWLTSCSLVGPLFLPVSAIFESEAEAAAHINSVLQNAIDAKARAVENLLNEMKILEARKLQQAQA